MMLVSEQASENVNSNFTELFNAWISSFFWYVYLMHLLNMEKFVLISNKYKTDNIFHRKNPN